MVRTKLICEYCGRAISRSNYAKHINKHKLNPDAFVAPKFSVQHDGLECQYCGKVCKNKNSLCNHERLCPKNPCGQKSPFSAMSHKQPWNAGLTASSDERILKWQETFKKNAQLGKHVNYGHKHTEEFKLKQRKNALANGLGGFAWRRGIYYNGIKLDSSYEVVLAEDLDANNVKWVRPTRLAYHFNGKLHYYTPDFYLPEYDVYLDPKNDFLLNNSNPVLGFSDLEKIKQVELENNIKVIILDKNHLTWEAISKQFI